MTRRLSKSPNSIGAQKGTSVTIQGDCASVKFAHLGPSTLPNASSILSTLTNQQVSTRKAVTLKGDLFVRSSLRLKPEQWDRPVMFHEINVIAETLAVERHKVKARHERINKPCPII